jgi:uncharacterized membrane protein
MNSTPLHPAMVHVPLGLAMLMPFLAAGFAWALWTGRTRPRAWVAIIALQALLVGAGFAAMKTGEAEEDRVEAIVPEGALHQHEERAEQFAWAAAATLGLAILVVAVRRPNATRGLSALAVLATVIVAGLAVRVGAAGGELVYVQGAAAAYTTSARSDATPPAGPTATAGESDENEGR